MRCLQTLRSPDIRGWIVSWVTALLIVAATPKVTEAVCSYDTCTSPPPAFCVLEYFCFTTFNQYPQGLYWDGSCAEPEDPNCRWDVCYHYSGDPQGEGCYYCAAGDLYRCL